MKKVVVLLVSFVMMIGLCACGSKNNHYQFWDGKCERCYNHGFIVSSHAQSGAFPR